MRYVRASEVCGASCCAPSFFKSGRRNLRETAPHDEAIAIGGSKSISGFVEEKILNMK